MINQLSIFNRLVQVARSRKVNNPRITKGRGIRCKSSRRVSKSLKLMIQLHGFVHEQPDVMSLLKTVIIRDQESFQRLLGRLLAMKHGNVSEDRLAA